MRMQDFQTQQIPHITEAIRMQDSQTHSSSANEHTVFPDTTKTTCYESATQCWKALLVQMKVDKFADFVSKQLGSHI